MGWTSRPFDGAPINTETEQRLYYSHLGDGIINARTLDRLDLLADGTSVLSLQPGEVKMRGLYGALDVAETFNLADPALAQPAAGQSRIDRLVIRLQPAATAAKKIAAAVVSGVPAVTPTTPALKWDQDGIWERELFSWRYSGVGLTQADIVYKRVWVGPHLVLSDQATLPPFADIGTTADRAGVRWLQKLGGANGWVADVPAAPVEWAWWNTPAPYGVEMQSGLWTPVPGSTLSIPVVKDHWYRMQSLCTLRADPNTDRAWRLSVWAGDAKIREVGGLIANGPLINGDSNELAVTNSGYWRADVTGNVSFRTQIATDGPLGVYGRFTAPVSAVEHMGIRR